MPWNVFIPSLTYPWTVPLSVSTVAIHGPASTTAAESITAVNDRIAIANILLSFIHLLLFKIQDPEAML